MKIVHVLAFRHFTIFLQFQAKDTNLEKSEQETKEEVKEEAIKNEQEGILPRRRGRSTLSSPKVTPLKKKKDKSPEEPSTTKEEVSRKNKKRKEILEPEKSPASRTEIKDETRRLKKIEKEEESDPSSVSESNVPKKKRGRPKRAQPEPEPSTSEDSSQEKEKENSSSTGQDSSPSIKEREPEKSGSTATPAPSGVKTDRKLPKQKGATHNKAGQKLIQPHKINLPEELCQIVENKKGKKMYQCQICSPKKEFNRKDIINYHAYNEHREELLEHRVLPEELTQDPDSDSSPPAKSSSNNAAAAVFGRIFKPKMMGGNKGFHGRKGQVEIQVSVIQEY